MENNKRIFNLIEGIKKVSVKRKENISLYFDCEKITEKNNAATSFVNKSFRACPA